MVQSATLLIPHTLFIVCLVGMPSTHAQSTQGESSATVDSASKQSDVAEELNGLLESQVAAWNRGDIPGFMKTYWQDPELSFSSGGTTTRGWKATKTRYEERYSTKELMGNLRFSELQHRQLGRTHFMTLGVWQLDREDSTSTDEEQTLQGRFTLIWRKVSVMPEKRAWRIIHDHTSLKSP